MCEKLHVRTCYILHTYALVAVGIMMFFTGVAVWIKYRGKTWTKGVLAIVAFLIGYAPWL